jgi:hypothetical protein
MTDLRTALKKTILGSKIRTVGQIADELGCCESLLYRYGLDGESGAEFPMARLIPLMRATEDYRLLNHVAARCGYVLVKLSRSAALKKKDPETINEIQARFSRLMSDFLSFTADASEVETLELLDQFNRHMTDMASMRRAVRDFKQGDLF